MAEETETVSKVITSSDLFPIPPDLDIGPQHFQKLKLLGRGGVGKVYLVLLKGTDKLYAMKELTKEEMIQRNKASRVMTEKEILATANHPFVMTMFASFQTKNKLYFVMEYCAGGEFYKVMQSQPKKRLTEHAARFYAAEIVLALEYLHQSGFIYRDLKPENVLMRANGHIALTDFDLSKQATAVTPKVVAGKASMMDRLLFKSKRKEIQNLDIVASEPVLAQDTNSFVGTEEYIAPEVVNGVAQTSAVDWWTLGILIYEMLTGTTPFKGKQQNETFSNILNKEITFPEELGLSSDCKNIIKKLLARDVSKRLGYGNGASDIKKHKWFKDINFPLIRNDTPAIIPNIRDPNDMTQYTPINDDEEETNENAPADHKEDAAFQSFNTVRADEVARTKY